MLVEAIIAVTERVVRVPIAPLPAGGAPPQEDSLTRRTASESQKSGVQLASNKGCQEVLKRHFREPSAACIFNKFTPPKHFENESLIYVRVVDSGPGVPDSIRETLFQPFVRDGKPHGTGLGPAIAECTARDHGRSVNPEDPHLEIRSLLCVSPRSQWRLCTRRGGSMRKSDMTMSANGTTLRQSKNLVRTPADCAILCLGSSVCGQP
jgi:hypothetical protein